MLNQTYDPLRLLPDLLVFLAGLLHDKQPIPATIKKTLQVTPQPRDDVKKLISFSEFQAHAPRQLDGAQDRVHRGPAHRVD